MHVLISLADGCVVCSPRFRCLCFGAFLRLAPKAHDRFESCVPIDSSSNMLDVTVQRTDLNQSSGLGLAEGLTFSCCLQCIATCAGPKPMLFSSSNTGILRTPLKYNIVRSRFYLWIWMDLVWVWVKWFRPLCLREQNIIWHGNGDSLRSLNWDLPSTCTL